MRTPTRAVLILFALLLASQPLHAQAVDLTDTRTADQKWTRSMFLVDFAYIGLIGYSKSMGQTTEQLSEFFVEFGAPTWGDPGSRTMESFVRGMFRNANLYRTLEFEILSESESEIRGRFNSPYAGRFGETGEAYGVTLQEFQQLFILFYEGTADYLGFDMDHVVNGEWIEFTVTTR